jgi:outer membrane protein TolC
LSSRFEQVKNRASKLKLHPSPAKKIANGGVSLTRKGQVSPTKEFLMVKRIVCVLFFIPSFLFAQFSLDYFINKAIENSPTLMEYQNLRSSNRIQSELNHAQNSALQVYLTGDYLFAPYFNNHGDLITTSPSPEAVGYDINLTDGGLYSAKVNVERNILNGRLTGILEDQIEAQDQSYQYSLQLEKHNLQKEVTDQYLGALHLSWLSRLSHETVSNLQQQMTLGAGLAEKGYLKLQDYLLLKIELKNQTIIMDDAYQQYKSSLYQLYALCGIRDTSVVAIDSVMLPIHPTTSHSAFSQKYVLDSLLTATEQTLFEARYWPQITLFFNTGLEAIELSRIDRRFGMSAGVNFSLPLFDGSQRRLTRQQNLLAQKTIHESRLYMERTVETQRRNFASMIRSLQKSIAGLEEQIKDYQKLLDISSSQLQQGNISMIDYLTLLKNYVDLRKNKIDMEINRQLEINNSNYWNW